MGRVFGKGYGIQISGILCLCEYSTLSIYLWGVLTLDDMTRGPRPLEDHVATVSAYLNDYKNQPAPEKQQEYSRNFTYYLISTCWKKIVRRITSWQAMGFIRFLAFKVSVEELEPDGPTWTGFPSDIEPGDKTLMSFLGSLGRGGKETIQKLLLDHIPSTYQSKVEDFITHCSDQCKSKYFLADCSDNKLEPLFSAKTVLEFHYLVVGAFTGFARAFLKIKHEYAKLVRMNHQTLEM
jgi:hypothetical protein